MNISVAAPAEAGSDALGASPPAVSVVALRQVYGSVVALESLHLDVRAGEFFTLLGPSGSGKTTTLRLIAGFERPVSGLIRFDGVDVTNQAPYLRDVNTVFQDYALFPHMTVRENVEYGLKVKRVRRAEARTRAQEALAMVGLEAHGDRKPVQLSGGQRQRVALARALVNRPRILLLDEPLGALDLKLREQMQTELGRIQRELAGQVTFIYVTHDQDEALRMSDRIAVLNDGALQQVGTPAEIYEHPASEFVAGFVGTSNILERAGRRYTIRPEKLHLLTEHEEAAAGLVVRAGVIREVVYLGAVTRYVVELDDGATVIALRQNLHDTAEAARAQNGRPVRLAWRPDHLYELGAQNHLDKENA